jgi:hypothetical protein
MAERAYRALSARTTTAGLSAQEALEHVDRLVQLAAGMGRVEGLKGAVALAEELGQRRLAPTEEAMRHFLLAVAWEELRLREPDGGRRQDVWEAPLLERELRHMRLALDREALGGMPREQGARMLSSTAALLLQAGRVPEALEHWDRAVAWCPGHALARVKRGAALLEYADVLPAPGQREAFRRAARGDLEGGLAAGLSGPDRERYAELLVRAGGPGGAVRKDEDLAAPPAGGGRAEERYRSWCLEERLVLNPMNDLGPFLLGARDTLVPPADVAERSGQAFYHGYFNQLKQAYVSARFLCYEGLNATEPHYADRAVLLFDTGDFPTYSLALEKLRASFAICYGLLDKTADLLSRYLGLPASGAGLRGVWYEGSRLRESFGGRRNEALRGLFWLSKDLAEDGFPEPLDPEAGELASIRQHLERGYLKLTEWEPGEAADPMALSVQRGEFEARTVKILKLARTALLHLCLGIHQEERVRDRSRGPSARLKPWKPAYPL